MILEDIPSPWWLSPLIWIFRFLRKIGLGRVIVFKIKNRTHLGLLTRLHLLAIHQVRDVCLSQLLNRNKEATYEKLKTVTNSFRDVMSDLLEMKPEEIHCTLKIISDDNEKQSSEIKVYTLARSSDDTNHWANRPMEYGVNHFHLASENSSFASLIGINDRKNNWKQNDYKCFVVDKINRSKDRYDSSGKDWSTHYNSTAVFPIRYKENDDGEYIICGFITFDAKKSTFDSIDIFDSKSSIEYCNALNTKSFFHLGGIMADTLVPVLMMYGT